MSMEPEILSLIEGDATLVGLAGRAAFASWGHSPDLDTLPRIVLHHISEVPDYHQGGSSQMVRSRVQADIWAQNYATAAAMDAALRQAADGYSSAQIDRIAVIVGADVTETSAAPVIYGRRIEFEIVWQE